MRLRLRLADQQAKRYSLMTVIGVEPAFEEESAQPIARGRQGREFDSVFACARNKD